MHHQSLLRGFRHGVGILIVFVVGAMVGLTSSACSREEDVTMEQLEVRIDEIGVLVLGPVRDLEMIDSATFSASEDEDSPNFFGGGVLAHWWRGYGAIQLAPEEPTTTEEAAELMASALEKDGWAGGRGGDPNSFYFDKTDDYGRWTVDISYTTDPPPQVRRVNFLVISPHAS